MPTYLRAMPNPTRWSNAGRRHDDPALKLSIVMPVFNEERTVTEAVGSLLDTALPCEFELVIVDDGSTDATPALLAAIDDPRARVIRHVCNLGKGAALRTGGAAVTGTHLVPFDADLEYDASDLVRLVEPVLDGRTEVVYGTRLFGYNTCFQSIRHALGNKAMTVAANLIFDACLHDLHTCLKLVPVGLFRELELSENGFGLDTELTAKLLRRGQRPFEVPISYHGRTVADGKKITWRDGVQCLKVLSRVRVSRPIVVNPQPLEYGMVNVRAIDEPARRSVPAGSPIRQRKRGSEPQPQPLAVEA